MNDKQTIDVDLPIETDPLALRDYTIALMAEVGHLRAVIRKAKVRVIQPSMDGGAHIGFTSCKVTSSELNSIIRAEQETNYG